MRKNIRKYNLSSIMKRAWELVKKVEMSLSDSLKKAWKEAKKAMEKKEFTGHAKLVVYGREHFADWDSAKFYIFNLWEKKEMRRIYVNDYKRRAVGYIDLTNNNVFVTRSKDEHDHATVNNFLNTYVF